MNTFLRSCAFGASLLIGSLSAFGADAQPSYLDFSDILPAPSGQFVEVDLDEGLLGLAAKFADGQEKEAAQVLRGLKSVHVRVISLDDRNRSKVLERVTGARSSLARDGWKRLAVAKDGNGQDVAVFARVKGDEAIQGLAVTVIDGDREAVIVNVVGEIRPDQISALGARFGVEPLKNLNVAAK